MKKLTLLFALFFCVAGITPAAAQVEMADTMRSEGKIYVVVAITLTVLAGLIIYLFLIERKVKKLENLLDEKQRQTK
jgi:uncharacterized membrane protein HdeD (DUF308 family)